jgi:hypothetical protein
MFLSGTIGTATAQKLDFNFHEDFSGKAVIVQEIDFGQEVKTVDGREQLNFPANGILLYQGDIESGYINHNYYRRTKAGDRIEIPERANHMYFDSEKDKPSTSEVGVWLEGMGMSTQFAPEELKGYNYFELIVASKDSLENYHDFHYNKSFDSMKYQEMKKCK